VLILNYHCPKVHGNASADCTANNAARCLVAFGAPSHINVYPGATKPLLRPARHDPEIHGVDGLGGVEGLPNSEDPAIQARFVIDKHGGRVRALHGMSNAVRAAWCNGHGRKVSIVSCGPMTNIALWVTVYPDLLPAVEQFVFMGGGVGLGNRSAVAGLCFGSCLPRSADSSQI
jgi:uridine nucleosidase